MAIETEQYSPYSPPVNVSPYSAQQNHALQQSPQMLDSTPLNHGVLYSTMLNSNRRLFIINGSLLTCAFSFFIMGTLFGIFTGLFYLCILTGIFLLICGIAHVLDLLYFNPSKAEIYSDHLKVCLFILIID